MTSSALEILTINDEKKDSLIFIYNLLHTIKIEIMGHARHYIGVVQPTNAYRDWETDRKSTRLNSSHSGESRMPSSA